MVTTILRHFSTLLLALASVGCVSTQRPPDPEYQGTIQLSEREAFIDVDTCGGAWQVITTANVYNVTGHGIPTPLYRGVQNVPEAHIARQGDTIFATSAREGLLVSENGGRTFSIIEGMTGIGKPRSVTSYKSEIVIADQRGDIMTSVKRAAWKRMPGVSGALAVLTVGGRLLAVEDDGNLKIFDENGSWNVLARIEKPVADQFDWSTSGPVALIVNEATLYRITASQATPRVDSVRLPQGGWRQVSCYRDDIALMRGRNEIWWGTFEEPLQARIPMEGQFDQRAVNMELTSSGLIAALRGTDQSLWLFIKNATTWEALRATDGLPVTDIMWLQRADTSVHVGTREGFLYVVDEARFVARKIAGNDPLMNILHHEGTGSTSTLSLMDGTILRVDQCGASPRPMNTPIPFRNGMFSLGWYDRVFISDAVEGVFVGEGDGRSWKRLPLPPEIKNVEQLIELNGRIYVYALPNLWSTTNDGQTWSRIGDPTDTVWAVRNSGKDLLLYAKSGWSFVDDGAVAGHMSFPDDLRERHVMSFGITNETIAVFTEKSLHVSNDRGQRWVEFPLAKESPINTVRIVDDRIFAFVPQTGVYMIDVYSDRRPHR